MLISSAIAVAVYMTIWSCLGLVAVHLTPLSCCKGSSHIKTDRVVETNVPHEIPIRNWTRMCPSDTGFSHQRYKTVIPSVLPWPRPQTSVGCCCSSLALLRSGSTCLSRLTFSALLLGRSIGSLSSLALSALFCGGGCGCGCSLGCLAFASLLRGSSCAALGSLALSVLLSSSSITTLSSLALPILFGSVTASGSCYASDVNAGSIQSIDVVLVASGYDGLDSLLKVRTRVGGTSCWLL